MKNNEKFTMTYSAPSADERMEIESIKRQYLPETERKEKTDKLKKVHSKTQNIPKIILGILCTVGILVFGTGLTMILKFNNLIWGSVVGILGIAIFTSAFYISKFIKSKLLQKNSDEILKLSDEILGINNEEENAKSNKNK